MSDIETLHKKQEEINEQIAELRRAEAEQSRIDKAAAEKSEMTLKDALVSLTEMENDSHKENKRAEEERHVKALAAIELAFTVKSDVPAVFRD